MYQKDRQKDVIQTDGHMDKKRQIDVQKDRQTEKKEKWMVRQTEI